MTEGREHPRQAVGARQWVIAILVSSCLLVALLLLVLALPQHFVTGPLSTDDERVYKARNELRALLLQAFAGIFLITTAVFTWTQLRVGYRTFQLRADEVAQTLKSTTRQLEISRDSALTDRYAKAIDHVGNDNLAVRLGGIYSLKRIATDFEGDRDMIVEVLAAFVRGRHLRPESADLDRDIRDDQGSIIALRLRCPDIQAALTVIGQAVPGRRRSVVDLAGADLRGADLSSANLARADLSGARLDGATLYGTDLTNADLRGTSFPGASLVGAHLDGADLSRAQLTNATVTGLCIRQARLCETDFTGSDLSKSILTGAYANDRTACPPGFDWSGAGVTVQDGR